MIWIGCSKLTSTPFFFSVFEKLWLPDDGFGNAFVLEGEG
jgi:hypothetical protein